MSCYAKAEKKSVEITKVYIGLLVLTVGLLNSAGIIQTISRVVVQEKVLSENYALSLSTSVPFGVDTWPQYLFALLWTATEMSCVSFPKVIVSAAFWALCLHIKAIMCDLQIIAKNNFDIQLVLAFEIAFQTQIRYLISRSNDVLSAGLRVKEFVRFNVEMHRYLIGITRKS